MDTNKTTKHNATPEELFTAAYNDYAKALGNYAFFKVSDVAKSEDLVQETFMKTWVYLMREKKIDSMRAFLYHVLNDLIVDEYRKRKSISLDTLLESGFEPSVDDSERLFDMLDGKSALLLVQKLPQKYQEAVCMRYVQGLSLTEISQCAKQSKNTVAVQVHRGLVKLKIMHDQVKA